MTDNPQVFDRTDDSEEQIEALVVPSAPPPMEPEPEPPRKWRRLALMWAVPILLLGAGGYVYLTSGGSVSTDNAYVQQDKVSVASEINGKIVEVAVRENQMVQAGDLLFRIDPAPYQLALAEAEADIAAAQVNVATLQSEYSATSVDISAARENIAFATATFDRQQALLDRGFTTKAQYDAARHALALAQDGLKQAQADARNAKAQLATGAAVPGQNPAIASAQARKAQALRNLSLTEVRAPFSGRVTQADRLQIGQTMVTGLPALTIVADRKSWVEANFKETDLDKMRVGQAAELHLDAYPELALKGHVASIGAGTGSEFSVLPAQNATGNWVKVTQRVPVRIAIDGTSPRPLIAGLSADVTVDISAADR